VVLSPSDFVDARLCQYGVEVSLVLMLISSAAVHVL